MRKRLSVITSIVALSLAAPVVGRADHAMEYSVQVSASVQNTPAQITLRWPNAATAAPVNVTIYRRAPGSDSWGQGTTLAGNATSFVDHDVNVGTPYEYQVVKKSRSYSSYGYIYSGIDVPLTENRGKLLLVVDNTFAADLAGELERLQQ